MVHGSPDTLADLPLRDLLARVADGTPAPGGGSVCAVGCSLAASLVEMAATFTLARSELADRHDRMREVQARAAELRHEALGLAERDLGAYAPVLEALALPVASPERAARLQAAQLGAAEPPRALARLGAELAGLGAELACGGNPNLVGDAVTAVLLAEAACRAAAGLVELNLAGFSGEVGGHRTADSVRRAWQSRLQALSVVADRSPSDQ